MDFYVALGMVIGFGGGGYAIYMVLKEIFEKMSKKKEADTSPSNHFTQ